ncbi:hypothetical protein CAL65_21800 [Alkalilimnicola ehrlichii]|uniref:Diguanylate cyclase/phosphodiesterase with PAS/PAC sensor(S) n=1 Tax=Alkalilimnicola ehrlichii TaxID=351052 RepID=A0A3E0WII0_9GAMM|nr:hypothetical protein CAL65_21800 [Alkalilimnicola ehrlichii]
MGRHLLQVSSPTALHQGVWGLLALVVVQSSVWASALAMSSYTGNPIDTVFLLFLFSALIFGGFATLAFYLPLCLAFTVPLMLGITVWVLNLAGMESLWLLATVAVVFGIMIQSALHCNRMTRKALLAGQEHEALIRRLTEEKERAQVTLRSIGDGVLTTDTRGLVTYINPVAERLTGWRNEEACGRALEDVLQLVDEGTGERVRDPVGACLKRDGLVALEDEVVLVDRTGERESSVQVSTSPIHNYDRQIIGAVIVAHDVTELRGMARVVSYQAVHDPLTGLVNRREFEARLWAALETARAKRTQHAMAYLDLDQFKLVNDTCGHVAGDELLKQLTGKFLRRVRDTDTLARLGGDEFGLLLYGCNLAQAREVADSLCAVVRDFRFVWDDKVFNIGVSIGLVPVDGSSTPTDLLAAADAACFLAKDQGRNRVHSVLPQDRELAFRHGEMQWTTRIQRALDDALFRLRVQRIQPLDPSEPMMAELLLSMVDDKGELVPPGAFLPAAERYNMMPSIDRHVVKLVFQRVAQYENDPQLKDIACFTINLSGQSLSDEGFLDYVSRQLQEQEVDPKRICFEITETAVIANLASAQRFIQELRQRGCKFALDDFGSGLSSFGYLRTLMVDFLKIDGLFVKHMSKDPIDYSMVESINQVGHVMGIRTIAEFVEDATTLEALRELDIDYGQGYQIHRPEVLL